MHFEFLERGIEGLQKSPKVIVVGEVGLGQLGERKAHKNQQTRTYQGQVKPLEQVLDPVIHCSYYFQHKS